MERRNFAVIATVVGLVLGALGDILFYGKLIGVSFPIFVILSAIALLALTVPAQQHFRLRNLWPLIPLLFFALMVAVRADWQIITLNVVAVMALGALVVFYLPLPQAMDEESLAQHTLNVLQTGVMVIPSAMTEASDSWGWLRERRIGLGNLTSAARGLMFAVPVVAVFGFLLGSADAVFATMAGNTINSFLRIFGIQYLGDTFGQFIVMGSLATLATGALGYGVWRRANDMPKEPAVQEEDLQLEEKRKPGFKLSMIESGIILGSVVALFSVFVVVQFAYFFGGRANINVAGLTFAEYARRGFFELVAVSVMTLGLALWLDHVTMRQGKPENRVFKILALMLVGLTMVMLVSAAQRMWLYEEAYGFTQLRVYTHIAIVWLGVLFGVFSLAVFRLRKNIFSLGSLVVMIGYLGTMNLMNVDAYIAERNIARYHEGHELDIQFLNILSADAVPLILPLYTESVNDPQVHEWSGQWLAAQLQALDYERSGIGGTVFSANLARQNAWDQLDTLRYDLPVYDPSRYWGLNFGTYRQEAETYNTSGWDYVVTGTPASP